MTFIFYFYERTESSKGYCNGLQVFPNCILCDSAYLTGLEVRLLEDTNVFLQSWSHYRDHSSQLQTFSLHFINAIKHIG
jgi:hypothetical protein